jgi:hypothetical protein
MERKVCELTIVWLPTDRFLTGKGPLLNSNKSEQTLDSKKSLIIKVGVVTRQRILNPPKASFDSAQGQGIFILSEKSRQAVRSQSPPGLLGTNERFYRGNNGVEPRSLPLSYICCRARERGNLYILYPIRLQSLHKEDLSDLLGSEYHGFCYRQ